MPRELTERPETSILKISTAASQRILIRSRYSLKHGEIHYTKPDRPWYGRRLGTLHSGHRLRRIGDRLVVTKGLPPRVGGLPRLAEGDSTDVSIGRQFRPGDLPQRVRQDHVVGPSKCRAPGHGNRHHPSGRGPKCGFDCARYPSRKILESNLTLRVPRSISRRARHFAPGSSLTDICQLNHGALTISLDVARECQPVTERPIRRRWRSVTR